jgi:CIC family chloride channel protein
MTTHNISSNNHLHKKNLISRFTIWRIQHISDVNFIYILAIVIGFLGGIAAVVIKNAVYFIHQILTFNFESTTQNYLFIISPIIGITLTVLFIKFILKKNVGDGIPNVLYAISKTYGKMKSHNLYSSILTSSLTVGFGGSVGLEGPTVSTGAGIGSNIAQLFNLPYRSTILLLGAASAAAMSAIFKAPITGIVFVLEVIMIDLKSSSLIPLLLTSVTADLTSYFFLGKDVIYTVIIDYKLQYEEIPLFILLAITTGLFSLYFFKTYKYITNFFSKIHYTTVKLIIGGFSLGLIVYVFPSLFGEGYESINNALHNKFLLQNTFFLPLENNMNFIFIIILLITLLKVIAMSITFNTGGIGGIFAPTLFIGSHIGLLFGLIMNFYFNANVNPAIFALVGMAGMIAGVIHGPLTAIFLIAELTNGYSLFIPLMIVASISFITIRLFTKYSVYTYQLDQRGELLTHDKDRSAFRLLEIKNMIETGFRIVKKNYSLGQLVKEIEQSSRNIFPIVNDNNQFEGVVFLDTIRKYMFKPEYYDKIFVKDVMLNLKANEIVDINKDTPETIVNKFLSTGNYNLPVIDNGTYLGFVSRANVLTQYRTIIKELTGEDS